MTTRYPFTALVGQDRLKRALLLNAVDPRIGGVLITGEKGAAKSTAARALVDLLPAIRRAEGCPFNCDPDAPWPPCPHCGEHAPQPTTTPTPFVELPIGATEDRVLGTLDLDQVLRHSRSAIRPGLLASAHRGILYVDEVNLLPDHLVDVLLDAAASGTNTVQREGVALSHPARFLLIGTMNPEEGELRPQLLDRFGLLAEIAGPRDTAVRTEIVRRRIEFDADPERFAERWAEEQAELRRSVEAAQERLPKVTVEDGVLTLIARLCTQVGVDGMRADLVLYRTARALAALDGRTAVHSDDVRTAAELALPHRRRRQPFEQPGLGQDELDQHFEQAQNDAAQQQHQQDQPQQRDTGEQQDRSSAQSQQSQPQHPPASCPPADDSQQESRGESPAELEPQTDPSAEDRDNQGDSGGQPNASPAGPASSDSDADAEDQATQVFAAGSPGPTRRIQVISDTPTAGEASGRRNPAPGAGHDRTTRAVRDTSPNELAVDATVRAAAQRGERDAEGQLRVGREDLHGRKRAGRAGTLILFAVDASGSMAARKRMEAVKGAVLSLLTDAYQQRDAVGVIAFRVTRAELVLPPTDSVERAERALNDLPTGGRTPLAHALSLAGQTIDRERRRNAERRPLLVLLTDGKANVPLPETQDEPWRQACEMGRSLATRQVSSLVLDSEAGYGRTGRAAELADAMLARHLPLDRLTSDRLLLELRQHSPGVQAVPSSGEQAKGHGRP